MKSCPCDADNTKMNFLITAFINVPAAFYRGLQKIIAKKPNLTGDREIEWSWILAHLPEGPGKALDFGCGTSYLALAAARRGFQIQAVNLQKIDWDYVYPGLSFICGDLRVLPLEEKSLDLVINCSTVEHIGLAGRYGEHKESADGDLEAMRLLKHALKPGARMIMTIPVGSDEVFRPMSRIYGPERLPRLLEGFLVEKEEYWIKESQNKWIQKEKTQALQIKARAGSRTPLRNYYGLGCFVLKRP